MQQEEKAVALLPSAAALFAVRTLLFRRWTGLLFRFAAELCSRSCPSHALVLAQAPVPSSY